MAESIPLSGKRGAGKHTLVDDELFDELSQWTWHVTEWGYVRRYSTRDGGVYMHRYVMGIDLAADEVVDHVNRDKLDNRRSNLRVVTRAWNGRNLAVQRGSSKYRGVTWKKSRNKWEAKVKLNGKSHYLGLYADEREAAEVARQFRMEHMPGALD